MVLIRNSFLVIVLLVFLTKGTTEEDVSSVSSSTSNSNNNKPANILMIMMDDLGYADIGSYGAEWDTPNLDSFLQSSLTLSRHYIGYVCSASRSQFLTGRYSFHNGYGTLDVFDIEKIGHIPLQTPIFTEYLKEYTNYITYGIGKWQLGNPTYNNVALSRGFDYFWGFNGGKQDYFTKLNGGGDDIFVDFWDNNEITNDWSDEYSTDQYFDKLTEIIDKHAQSYKESCENNPSADGDDSDSSSSNEYEPFFIYAALQTVHDPFPTYENMNDPKMTNYYKKCMKKYSNKFNDFDDRISVCECMLSVDEKLGELMTHFQSSDELKAIWDNTIILFTSDNGGSIDKGSCNYPLRGGKNTFYDGNVRVLAAVGGGLLPESQQGKELEGLVSNVDWVPTLLTFAGVIPNSQSMITFDHTGNSNYQSLDGYNMYNYIMYGNDNTASSDDDDNDNDDETEIDASTLDLNQRDHILFHITPSLDSDTNEFTKDISSYTLSDMDEIAIIFYDDDGTLWKYLDVSLSTNIIGDPTVNSGWCVNIAEQSNAETDSDDTYTLMPCVGIAGEDTIALYEISKDSQEKLNYIESDIETAANRQEFFKGLKEIIEEKLEYYTSVNKNSDYLFGSFYCFVDYDEHYDDAVSAAEKQNAWVPFVENNDDLATLVKEDCNLDETHNIYKLLTTSYSMPDTLIIDDDTINEKNKNDIINLNNRVPEIINLKNNDETESPNRIYMESNLNLLNEEEKENEEESSVANIENNKEAYAVGASYDIGKSMRHVSISGEFFKGLLIACGIILFSVLMYLVFMHVIGDNTKEIATKPAMEIKNSLQGYQPL